MIWDDNGLVSESRWISRTLPLSEIFLSSSLQKSSSLTLSWWTDFLRPSEETRELKRSSFTSVDSGGAERDWKLYRKQKSQLISSSLHMSIVFSALSFLKWAREIVFMLMFVFPCSACGTKLWIFICWCDHWQKHKFSNYAQKYLHVIVFLLPLPLIT